MNKNKLDLSGYIRQNSIESKASNIYAIHPEKKISNEITSHNIQNRIKDNDFNDLTKLVKNSVEKINDLFSQNEFQTKNKYTQKPSRALKFEISDIDEYDEINKSRDIKPKERSNTSEKSSKANFTFNINNFINVPNMSNVNNVNTSLPNISQISQEKSNNNSSVEYNDKINIKSIMNNKNTKSIYLNHVKKSMTIEHKGFSKSRKLYFNELNNYTMNDSLYQIDEIKANNSSTNNRLKTSLKNSINNPKNIKSTVINSKSIKNKNTNKTPEQSKPFKEFDQNNEGDINNMIMSGLNAITQNRKVLYRMPVNKKSDTNTNLNTSQKLKNQKQINLNRSNKYKSKQSENQLTKVNNKNKHNIIKRNNDINYKSKTLRNKDKLSQSKKMLKTGENFHSLKKEREREREKEKNDYENNDLFKSMNLDESPAKKNKIYKAHEQKSKINIKEEKYRQNNLDMSVNLKIMENLNGKKYNKNKRKMNLNLKTMDDISNRKYKQNSSIIGNNTSDLMSSSNSPINISIKKNNYRGSSIPNERRNLKNKNKEKEISYNSSGKIFHHVMNIFYGKEFPANIDTNDILKLMLFFNEYIINNNLLHDCKGENRKLLNNYSKYISSKIKVDFPQEHDIVVDPSIKCVKKIQRKWRKRKIEKFLKKNKKTETEELKKMIVNKYIQNSGFKVKKILGLFNTIVENFDNINKQPDINELFYQIQKLNHNKLTEYEKNLLYKEFINNVIFSDN